LALKLPGLSIWGVIPIVMKTVTLSFYDRIIRTAAVLGMALLLGACASTQRLPENASVPYTSDRLLQGDLIRVVFPGIAGSAEELAIPPSGKINLAYAGEYDAVGKTIAELEQEILQTYGPRLKVPEITITLLQSSAAVYVTGAVRAPGKFPLNRPLTLTQAIMEAGGPLPDRSRLDRVQLVRYEDGIQRVYQINVKKLMKADNFPIHLRPDDMITVPVRVFNL
jgi:protein involved in polysaccharide export with SLBB domain